MRYLELCAFDKAMNKWESLLGLMQSTHQYLTLSHEEDKLIIYEKGPALFVFNFHTNKSFEDYQIGTIWNSDHVIVFDSDREEFGGHKRLSSGYKTRFVPKRGTWQNRPNSIRLYLPCRSAMIPIAEENLTEEIIEKGQITLPSKSAQKSVITTQQPATPEESKGAAAD